MAPAYRTSDWLSEVDNLSLSATVAAPAAQAGHLRALCLLIRLRPDPLGGQGLDTGGERDVMRKVASGAYDAAAMRLAPEEARLMTSNPGRGRFLASVRLRGQSCGSTSSGRTFALAIVSALALAIVEHRHELRRSPAR